MNAARLSLLALFVLSSHGSADETDRVRFAAPQRIKAGDKFLGEGRLYPSPVLHDMDGDKRADLVVADLFGNVTVATRAANPPASFAAEIKLNDRDGKPLRFHNW
jgi:hypothetical protein